MNTSELKKAKQLTTDLFLLDGNIEDADVADLVLMLKTADDLYFNDQESFISDEQYDSIKRIAEQLDPFNAYFIGVGSEVRGGKVKLPVPLGSLTQVYENETEEWIKKYSLLDEDIVITDKLDGVSCLLVYGSEGDLRNGYSRGDGINGQVLTSHINNISAIPKKVKNNIKFVRGELIISSEKWKIMQQITKTTTGVPYANARNCIAGLMNTIKQHPKEVYSLIDFVAYEIKETYEENVK